MTEGRARIAEFGPQRFRRYPDYRDSGVEWLGEIPAHWEVRLRTVNGCQNGVYETSKPTMNKDRRSVPGRTSTTDDVLYNDFTRLNCEFIERDCRYATEQARLLQVRGWR